ncbi:MAG: NHL repeat-containing protein [Caldilineaceae bacterium]|nr:NHL repeat-containing protein [Caldilineaceae bacterium]
MKPSDRFTQYRMWMNSAFALVLLTSLAFSWQSSAASSPAGTVAAMQVSIYADALAPGWEDWSWDTTTNPANANPVHSGLTSYGVTYDAAWGGFYLHADPPVSTAGYTHLRFWIHGGITGGQQLLLKLNGNETDTLAVTASANQWQQVDAVLSDLGNPATLSDIYWQDATGGAQPTYFLDDIALVTADSGPGFPDATPDRTLNFPGALSGVAIAPNGRIYVAAWRENRVYSWPNAQSAADPANSADLIFGDVNNTRPLDPNAGCGSADTSATLLCGPESVAVDAQNNLYVADTYNHRVLVFLNPATDADPLEADFVLGQGGSFATHDQHKDAPAGNNIIEGFSYPRGLTVDGNGDLWVVDEYGYRVLKFVQPLATDAIPDLAVGQPNLESRAAGTFQLPLGVAVDSSGNVYVADIQAKQVLRFDTPAGNVTAASQIYSDYAGPNAFDGPTDVAFDPSGNLYAAYVNARRVGVFAAPLADNTGDYVIEEVNYPHGMAFDVAGNLYVALCNAPYPCDGPGKLLVFNAPDGEPPPPPDEIALAVDVAAGRKPISPYIYGLNFAKEAFAAEIDLPLRRWGGNATSRYNWQTGHTNHAADWFFHNNVKYDEYTGAAQSADEWVAENKRTGAASLITLPMSGYVAKDGEQATCAYKVSKYGPQDAVDSDSGFPDCGNGLQNGQPINNDPLDTSIAVDENFSAGWVTHLKDNAAANGAVQFYALDNEPDIWFETQRDVAPTGWKYAEFRDLSFRYGAAAKSADPAARLFGPVVNGWTYYWHGAYDGQRQDWETPDDRNSHGGTPFLEWYLQQMHAYEQTQGVRLLDYLTVNFYPQNGVSQTLAGDAAKQALRLRSTRALWDPAYVDESWIAQAGPDGGIVRLIPRLRAWVDAHYPGTKLALTEYNWGGLEHINGALTQADILGIFGREGLDVAALWNYPVRRNNDGMDIYYDIFETLPGAYAFRVYRNYDGQGAKFGETSVHAASSDQGKLSIYAAQRSSDHALTIVVVNKTSGPLTANLTIANLTAAGAAQVYRYSAANLDAIERLADQPVSSASSTATYPANSITLLVIPAGGANERIFLPLVAR